MTHSERQRSLFSAAIDIFLRHTLCETQLRSSSARTLQQLSTCSYAGGLFSSSEELCQCLQKIVERENHSAWKLDNVHYELAMVDRWNECIIWSDIRDKCHDPSERFTMFGSRISASWQSCLALQQHSAYSLASAMRAANSQDTALAADWVTVSSLSDAAVRQCALFSNREIGARLEERSCGYIPVERVEVCDKIIALLEKFPEIVVGDIESFRATVIFKKSVAEGIVEADRSADDRRFANATLVQDFHIVRDIAATVLTALQGVYASPYELAQDRDTCRSNMVDLNTLLSAIVNLLRAVDACCAFVGEWKSHATEILKGMHAAVAELPSVAGMAKHLNLPVSTAVKAQLSALLKRVEELLTAAHELKSKAALTQKAACPRRELAQLYDSKAAAALSVSPQSQYHVQLAQCWNRAAALVRSATDGNKDLALAGKYAELAEGVLSSAVTCHEYQRCATARNDARVAKVWARLLMQARAVSELTEQDLQAEWKVEMHGEEVDTGNNEKKRSRNKMISAVHLADQAMRVLYGNSATPLQQRLEADLQVCAADCYMSSDAARKEKLLTVAQHLHGLLHALQRPIVAQGLSLGPLHDSQAALGVLQSLVSHFYTLADALAEGLGENENAGKAWQSSVDATTGALSVLKRADPTPIALTLALHSVDLLVLTLQLNSNATRIYGELIKPAATMVLGVVRMDHGNDTQYMALTAEHRERLRCFRLYHALRYEQEVLLPLASLIANFKALEYPPPDVGPIAELPYTDWVINVIAASNSAVSCARQAEAVGVENAEDLMKAAGHYARAALFLAQQADHDVVGSVASSGALSARLALMSARACENAHEALLAGASEACALYRKDSVMLPNGATVFRTPAQNKDIVKRVRGSQASTPTLPTRCC